LDLHGSDSKALIPDGIKKSNTKKTRRVFFHHIMNSVDTRVHGAKPNAYASFRKPGGNGILQESGPSSSYFLDNPEKKEITRIFGNPFRFTGVPNPDMIGMISCATKKA
jgi:hypothetical protein